MNAITKATSVAVLVSMGLTLTAWAAEPPVPPTTPSPGMPTKGQLDWADLEFGHFIHFPSAGEEEGLAECAALMGARYLLIVAKHNNGYIFWHSKTDVRIGVQKDGKPDIVGNLVAAARKRNLKIAFYCVPADWGDGIGDGGIAQNGDMKKQEAWRAKYIQEVTELCTKYGPVVEFWFDGGIGGELLDRVNEVLRKHQPDICSFNGLYNPVRWVGNEEGHVDPNTFNRTSGKPPSWNGFGSGSDPRSPVWAPVECDTFMAGWGRGTGRSIEDLMRVYYRTVGRGAQLTLDMSRYSEANKKICADFGARIRDAVGHPLAATTGKGDTVELDLGSGMEIDHVIVQEDLSQGERVIKHRIEYLDDGAWKPLAEGTALGHKRIYPFTPVIARKVRVTVQESLAQPIIRNLAVTRTGRKVADLTPPTAPADLAGKALGNRQAVLQWSKADDPDSGVADYVIYRDGVRIGRSKAAEFTDPALDEQVTYEYAVAASNGSGLEGPRSGVLRLTTPPDTEPPTIRELSQINATRLRVVFSEPVEEASAAAPGNYALDQGAQVRAATLEPDGRTVILTTTPLTELATHTVRVSQVRDRARKPLVIAPDAKASLRCANGLLLYCPLNEGTGNEVVDQASNRKLTISGTPRWSAGDRKTLLFDGKTAIDLGLAPHYDAFTIAVWVKPDRGQEQVSGPGHFREAIFSRDRAGQEVYAFHLNLNTYASPEFVMSPPEASLLLHPVYLLKPYAPAAGTWIHLAVTRDAATGTFRLYVDGSCDPGQGEKRNPEINHPYNPVSNLILGGQMRDNLKELVPSFQGSLRDFRLYDRAFTKEELADLMRRTKP